MKLKVLFIPTANAGINYWRFVNFWGGAFRQELADVHVLWYRKDHTEVHPWERDILKAEYMWRLTKEMQDWVTISDVIVFGMLHGTGFKMQETTKEEYISESMGIFRAIRDMFRLKPILSEIDDNMLSTPDYNPANALYGPGEVLRELAITQFKESDGLIVSTPYLKELYSDFNDNIHVIRNVIDFQLWDKAVSRKKKGIRIGWAGGASHNGDLKPLETIIPKITAKYPDVKFVIFHGCPDYLKNIPKVEFVKKWARIDKYPQAIASLGLDIGMAPLVDSAFNRAKSNLRWLEYSALGIPTVASKVGHFAETIRHGVDGFLAESNEEFEAHLELLIKNKSLRKQVGAEAQHRVFSDFNVDTESITYMNVLRESEVKTERVPETVQ